MTNIYTIAARLALGTALALGVQGCLSGGDSNTGTVATADPAPPGNGDAGGRGPSTPPPGHTPAPAPAPAPAPEPEPAPTPDPEPDPTPDPEPDPTPDPTPDPEPEPDPEPAPTPPPGDAPGGFIEDSISATPRGLLSASQIAAFLPSRGPFNFPAPYNTRGARITNADDCGGQDCVFPVGYSYWRNTNYHVNDDEMLIFLGMNASRGGNGPTLFRYNKITEEVSNAGPLFPAGSRFAAGSGEMWYFSPSLPNILYIRDGSKLVRYDVIAKTSETVFDAVSHFGSGHYIWQIHTSNDDRVHSATLRRSSDYSELGCFVYLEDTGEFRYFARKGSYDECQIDRSGRWLVIKEQVDGVNGMDNRFIDLQNGNAERFLADEDGAGGHSDMGHGVIVAADNWGAPNAWRLWDPSDPTLDGRIVYRNNQYQAMAPAHASFVHSRADVPFTEQYMCGSAASSQTAVHANEVICFLLDGANNDTLVVAPVMTDQGALGGGDSYSKMPKGNLDITGQYFLWTSNMGGNRVDAFIVKVPAQKLYDN